MTELKMKVTRQRKTVADRLRELDEQTARERERQAKKVADAEAALEKAQTEQRVVLAQLAERRAKIVSDALAKAAELTSQVGGAQ